MQERYCKCGNSVLVDYKSWNYKSWQAIFWSGKAHSKQPIRTCPCCGRWLRISGLL